ncbi:hypothetical protein [Afipia felis]|uniref:Uncharacterized protein n=2 Tax=Afipia felis TaxID=1035 RepID=A0A380WCT4_AFIFE|nr:hypothetical protein [Afipia felis]EKS29175.1 hypothetical protein HMPREF9697_01703 [Afipia felis ATCC 53690]SUU77882.1 Uncharacterised protein [Afipia felis]SUU85947.1 Uncharacterised protein [Afipia felis]
MVPDKRRIIHGSRELTKLCAHRFDDLCFNLGCWNTADAASLLLLTLYKGCGNIVPILYAVLASVTWRHSLAVIIKYAASQYSALFHSNAL